MLSHIKDTNNSLTSFHKLTAKKRLELIINHKHPLQLVRALPAQDILLTIRELGKESSLEIVEMMHPEQVRTLFDLEIWPHDKLDVKTAGHYIKMLLDADVATAVKQIHGLDIELIGLMFKIVSKIYDVTLGEEPDEVTELHSVTPDGRFIICFSNKNKHKDLAISLHTFLNELYGRDLRFALRLLENIRFEFASHLEEECIRWKEGRLLDLGILPAQERLEFFSPLLASEIKNSHCQKSPGVKLSPSCAVQLFSTATHIDDEFPFLKQGLATCTGEVRSSFEQSLLYSTLNMHTSLSGDFGDRTAMENTCTYVKFLIELGIVQATAGKIDQASNIITYSSQRHLIRFARTSLVALRKRLLNSYKKYPDIFGEKFCHADSPLRETAQALCLSEPCYYEGLLDPRKLTVRFFSTLKELNATVDAIHELIFRAELVSQQGDEVKDEYKKATSHLSHAGCIARIVIKRYLDTKNLSAEISTSLKDSKIFFDDDGTLTKDFKNFVNAFADDAAKKIIALSDSDDEQKKLYERTHNFFVVLLIQLEQNWQLLIT